MGVIAGTLPNSIGDGTIHQAEVLRLFLCTCLVVFQKLSRDSPQFF